MGNSQHATSHRSFRNRRSYAALSGGILILAASSLTGCGGSDSATATTASATATTAAGGSDAGTATTGATADGTAAPAAGGSTFTNSAGTAQMETGPDWTPLGAEGTWQIGTDANVNLLAQPSAGMDLDAYLDLSKQQFDAIATVEIVDTGKVDGANGRQIGYMEYKGTLAEGMPEAHYFAYVDINNDTAAIATITAAGASWDEVGVPAKEYTKTVQAL